MFGHGRDVAESMTQGRLYAEDLNQFTGRGIPMIRELAKELGVAENELRGILPFLRKPKP